MSAGKLITLEGIEGVGKSTHCDKICRYLRDRDIEVLATREPGGTALGESVRQLLLADGQTRMDADTELLLIFAARAEHLKQVIRPALQNGQWVVCDRFTDASYAYQGAGRGIPNERIAILESFVQRGLHPGLTLLLDMDVRQALERTRRRGPQNRFEYEEVAFFERVRRCYLKMAGEQPERFRTIDASAGIQTVERVIAGVIDAFLGAQNRSV